MSVYLFFLFLFHYYINLHDPTNCKLLNNKHCIEIKGIIITNIIIILV